MNQHKFFSAVMLVKEKYCHLHYEDQKMHVEHSTAHGIQQKFHKY